MLLLIPSIFLEEITDISLYVSVIGSAGWNEKNYVKRNEQSRMGVKKTRL